jgi:hypothetical protein
MGSGRRAAGEIIPFPVGVLAPHQIVFFGHPCSQFTGFGQKTCTPKENMGV